MFRLGPHPLKNPWVLAPMAGVSEEPFRVLAFRMGAALCPTELVSAQGLMRANARTVRYLRHDAEVERARLALGAASPPPRTPCSTVSLATDTSHRWDAKSGRAPSAPGWFC